MATNPNIEREISQGNNVFFWDGEDDYPVNEITNAIITQVIGTGTATCGRGESPDYTNLTVATAGLLTAVVLHLQ